MSLNSNIFRAYDIRGVFPEEINEEAVYLIGRSFVKFLKKKNKRKNLQIVVGRDNRLSSTRLYKYLTKGIIEEGADVINIGLVPTPVLYFSVAHFKFDGGVMITASHNPPQYNGLKLVGEASIPISSSSGLQEIRNIALSKKFGKNKKGKLVYKRVLSKYIDFNLQQFDLKKISGLKIAVDTGNGVAGILVSKIFRKIDCRIYHLFSKLDGNFPNHLPDPLVEENLRFIKQFIKTKDVDLGMAFDGDGDRIIFIDEKGRVVPGDIITALMSKIILEENPGEKILYDIRSTNATKEVIEESGGIAIAGRIGHSFIKEKMRKKNIIFGGELSGHYYLRDYYFCEAPLFVVLKILEKISQTKKRLSELIKPLERYSHSKEINFRIRDRKKILKTLENRFKKAGRVLKIDGLRIDFKDWWFLVRASNTELVLRLVVEARSKKLMKEKINLIKSLIVNG